MHRVVEVLEFGLVARSRIDLPAGLPPPSAGLFGAIGYDMIRLAEHLPDVNPDPLGLPDGVMTRPSIVAIFDAIAQEILLVTPVRPNGLSAKEAYAAAERRLAQVRADSQRPTPALIGNGEPEPDRFTTPVSRADYAEVVAKAHNAPIARHDPTAHAEILALRAAAEKLGNYRLTDLTLFVTLEPCAMCAGAISHARIGRGVFGAEDPKGGAVVNGPRFFEQPTCHWRPAVEGGLLAEESSTMLRSFFKARRGKRQTS